MNISPLKQVRLNHGWSRPQVEEKTNGRVTVLSLLRWENGKCWPHAENIEFLCQLYGKTREELGFKRDSVIMGIENAPTIQEGTPIMSEMIRRAMLSNLSSRLTGLIDLWPRRDYRYSELQSEINKAIFDHHVLVQQGDSVEISRREALQSMALVPIQLVGGIAIVESGKIQKTDTDVLLKHVAAGITAAWYLRRGKDLNFVYDLMSTYIALLQPLILSQSEAYRKAATTLLSQSFRLKGSIANALKNGSQAMPHYHEAIRYGLMAENRTEQAIANRMVSFSHKVQGTQGYEQALFYAKAAYGLVDGSTPRMVRSFIASGLSLCQGMNGRTEDAKISLSEARDYFDGVEIVPSLNYTESNLLAINALVHQYCGLWGESVVLWGESLSTPDITAIGSIQAHIQYIQTEVSRDDQPRNMDLCIELLTKGITGARELKSERYIREARECYNLLRVAWPRENAVKTLGRDHFGM